MLCIRQQKTLNLFTTLRRLSCKGKLWSSTKSHTIDQKIANRNVGNNFHSTQQIMAENNPVHTLTTYRILWQRIIRYKQSHHITQNGKQKFSPQFHTTLQIMTYTDLDHGLTMYSKVLQILIQSTTSQYNQECLTLIQSTTSQYIARND